MMKAVIIAIQPEKFDDEVTIANFNFNEKNFLPIFSITSGYDLNLFIRQFATNKEKIDVIAKNK